MFWTTKDDSSPAIEQHDCVPKMICRRTCTESLSEHVAIARSEAGGEGDSFECDHRKLPIFPEDSSSVEFIYIYEYKTFLATAGRETDSGQVTSFRNIHCVTLVMDMQGTHSIYAQT